MSLTIKHIDGIVRAMRGKLIPSSRELGDLRRNAALYIATRAKCARSSFHVGRIPPIDVARFSEISYLGALGFLVGAHLISVPLPIDLVQALERVSRRNPHTAEGRGFADDAVCAVGLLLLARASNNDAISKSLEQELLAKSPTDPSIQLLVALVLSDAQFPLTDANSVSGMAAALLAGRADDNVRKQLFPVAPSDLDARLTAQVVSAQFDSTEDFSDMLVLVALEACLALPEDAELSIDKSCDLGIVVALKEEFRILFEKIKGNSRAVQDDGRTYYLFEAPTLQGGKPYRCVATLIGDMGPTRAGIITEKLIVKWRPALIAMLGIAGGIHGDVRLGDVVVATQVNNYVEGAKAIQAGSTVDFQPAGDSFKSTSELVDHIRNFEFSSPHIFSAWQKQTTMQFGSLAGAGSELLQKALLRERSEVREGHIASGPLVVTSTAFADWIRSGDRTCLAVEMEAGGLMVAAHPTNSRTLILRGISDLADERKGTLDGIGGGAIRALAMENVVSFLWALMHAGLLPRLATE